MTVRNIRSHRARGLLPAPEVRDRVGYYGPEHLARLRMIQELQAEGFNLKGIERLLERSPGPAEEFLSFKRTIGASFETEEPQAFTREELAERFPSENPDATLKRSIDAGSADARRRRALRGAASPPCSTPPRASSSRASPSTTPSP